MAIEKRIINGNAVGYNPVTRAFCNLPKTPIIEETGEEAGKETTEEATQVKRGKTTKGKDD